MLEDIKKYVMKRSRDLIVTTMINGYMILVLELGKSFMLMVSKVHYVICYGMVTKI